MSNAENKKKIIPIESDLWHQSNGKQQKKPKKKDDPDKPQLALFELNKKSSSSSGDAQISSESLNSAPQDSPIPFMPLPQGWNISDGDYESTNLNRSGTTTRIRKSKKRNRIIFLVVTLLLVIALVLLLASSLSRM